MTRIDSSKPVRRPKLKLPFDDKKSDIGEWTYDNRVGLCVTVIAYLVLSIAFVSAKIFVGEKPHTQGMYIDLQDVAQLEELRDQLQAEVDAKQEQIDWGSVSNRASNENALDDRVKDDRGTNTSELMDAASSAQSEMAANREAYEKAMAEIDAIGADRGKNGEAKEHKDAKVAGNVTVSFSFVNPIRNSRDLVIPAYRCQSGGEVVIAAKINRDGFVIDAQVQSGGDQCMRETALTSAQRSRFDSNSSAPAEQSGTITYIFIPQ